MHKRTEIRKNEYNTRENRRQRDIERFVIFQLHFIIPFPERFLLFYSKITKIAISVITKWHKYGGTRLCKTAKLTFRSTSLVFYHCLCYTLRKERLVGV